VQRLPLAVVGLLTLGAVAIAVPGSASPRPRVELLRTGFHNSGEPNIGITRDGTLFSTVKAGVVRSRDHGRHWTDVTPTGHVQTLDPFLYVDPTTDRVFKSDLSGTCQLLSWSDDRGETWTPSPAACNLSDHQSISAGKPITSPTVGYPNVVYDCSQTLGYNGYSAGSGCDKSLDGGRTWTPTGSLAFSDPSPYGVGPGSGDSGVPGHCLGDVGAIQTGPDGTLYVPRGWCNQPWLAVSHDEGLTWTRTQVARNGMNTTLSGGFGVVAPGSGQSDYQATAVADGKGHVYFFWVALDRMPYLAVSRNGGKTFGAPIRVAAAGLKEAWGPAIDLDAKGRVALAYMGSSTSPGKPWTGSYSATTFTGYLALLPQPLSSRPVVLSAPVTTDPDEALVRGRCGPGRCDESVLDFIDVALAPDGSVYGSFIDSRRGAELVIGHLTYR
jgi:hypothetical protein